MMYTNYINNMLSSISILAHGKICIIVSIAKQYLGPYF